MYVFVFFFKQKTAYEMRISDWSSDVCSSDLAVVLAIDGARERISLGVKQVNQDPMSEFLATNTKGEMVKGVAKTVDARGAVIDLGNGIEGYIKRSEERRVGKECVRTCRSGWWPYTKKKKKYNIEENKI